MKWMHCLPLKCKHYQIVSQEELILLHMTCLFVLGMQPSEYREALGIVRKFLLNDNFSTI